MRDRAIGFASGILVLFPVTVAALAVLGEEHKTTIIVSAVAYMVVSWLILRVLDPEPPWHP